MQKSVEIDRNGRILVPATFRKYYNWPKGVKLTLKVSKEGLILTTKQDKIERALEKMRRSSKSSPGVKEFLKFRKKDQD